MSALKFFSVNKDPQSVLDYTIDWSDWLEDDTITASTWAIVADSGLTQPFSPSFTTLTTTIWLGAGTVSSQSYTVTNHITTIGGRQEDAELQVTVKNTF